MAGKLNVVELFKAAAVASSSAEASAQNLLTDDPKEVFTASGAGPRNIFLDLGSAVTVDSFYVGYSNALAGTMRPFTVTNLAGAGPVALNPAVVVRAADAKTERASRLVRLAAPVTSRYFQFALESNVAAWQVGQVRVGLAFEAEWDREWGSGRRPVDTGRSTALLGGGFGTQDGVRKGAYSWTFGDLTEEEVERLWAIYLRRGTTNPVLVNEWDGATVGANEKLHYGLFQRLDAFERREPNATKWAMELEEWV